MKGERDWGRGGKEIEERKRERGKEIKRVKGLFQ